MVRFYSPMETIGGGVILEPNPGVKKRFHQDVIDELKRKESGSVADVIELHIREHGKTLITLAELAKMTALSEQEIQEAAEELKSQGQIQEFQLKKDTWFWHADSRRAATEEILAALTAYERKYPYRYGMKKAEVQGIYFQKIRPNLFDRIIEFLEEEGCVKREGEFLCTPDYQVRKDGVFDQVSSVLLDTFKKARFDFVRYSEISLPKVERETGDDILNILLVEGSVVKVTEDMYTLKDYMEEARQAISAHLADDPVITIAQVRDMFQTSRKSAKPILEYMDSIKVTKKTGAESERVAY